MSKPLKLSVAAVVASMSVVLFTFAPDAQTQAPAQAQKPPQQGQQAQQPQQPAPPKPYKTVSVTIAPAAADPSLDAFRKQLADIAARKDRDALTKVVAKDFFWETGKPADKNKSGPENFAAAVGLDAKDNSGWQLIADYAAEPSASAMEEQKGVVCSPAAPVFKEEEFKAVLDSTQTDPGEWGYTLREGIEVRETADANGKTIEKLGLQFVRVMPEAGADPSKPPTALRVVAPSGKVGFIPLDSVFPLGIDQLCYKKEGSDWKIAGYLGPGAAG